MYQRLCGELGIPRKEFYHELTFHEANLLCRGLDMRYRATYNANRLVANVVAQLLSGKPLDIHFPWDNEYQRKDDDEWTQEELEEFLGKPKHTNPKT